MSRSALLVLLTAVELNGCMFGTTPSGFRPATAPQGTAVVIQTRGGATLWGEMLAISDTALTMAASGRIVLVPYAVLNSAWLPDLGTRFDSRGPSVRSYERVRLHCRFPQGTTPELLERLLEAYDQPELEIAS